MAESGKLLQVKCTNSECQQQFRLPIPSTEGVYKVVCPACNKDVFVKVPKTMIIAEEEMEAIRSESNKPEEVVPAKTHVLPSEDALRYPGCVELVKRFWKNQSFDLKLGKNLIGRKDEKQPSDISIENDMGVSRQSINIDMSQDEYGYHFKLKVLRCKNPILRNGTRMNEGEEVALRYGDVLQLGETKLKFLSKK